ncbi:MAG: tetratricopeptide repeat protein [Candidatus Blackburnbacteria bacterium]|nr:tetratricopeptide repeat protein [Candidatus Blackburnbacteria bacterium]
MKSLSTVQSYIIRSLVFLMPLFFLPVTSDFFNINKIALLVTLTLVLLILWGLQNLRQCEFSFRTNPLDLPNLFFAVALVVSAFVATFNKLDAFAFPGVVTVVVASVLFYFVVVQYLTERDGQSPHQNGKENMGGRVEAIVTAWVTGVTLASLILLLSNVGVFGLVSKVLPVPVWLKTPFFSPAGSLFGTILLFIASAPVVFGRVMKSLNVPSKGSVILLSGLMLSGFVIFIASTSFAAYQVLPGKKAAFANLPFSAGWSIALEAFKQKPLFGVGPGNFVEAFSRFRPVEYNATKYWDAGFSASSNWYLDIFTTAGLVGLLALGFILYSLRKIFKNAPDSGDMPYVKASLVIMLLIFLFSSATTNLIFVFFVALAILGAYVAKNVRFEFSVLGDNLNGKEGSFNLMALIVSFVASIALVLTFVFGGKVYMAEVAYRDALDAVANRGKYKDVMDAMSRAINLNPNADRYRIEYSQIMLALMQEIASKKELTDADKKDISQLVQQAVEQGKVGVALNQRRAANWANLGVVYRNLMSVVTGADQFTITVYRQAVSLDPVNPNLRIALGGIFYALKDYDNAINAFQLAVTAKPDLANAHYNLAIALRDAGKTAQAASEMQQALDLVKSGSQDFELAKKELDSLQAKLKQKAEEESSASKASGPALTGQGQAPLTAPQPAPSPVITPKLELPAGGQPPATSGAEPQQ